MPVVLLVDDDDGVREVLARLVARLGHEVLHAASADAGVNLIRARRPDLIVTDMEMAGQRGFDVLDEGLRAKIPVVILTGYGCVTLAVEAMRRGASN